jgi:hypothetical protein
MSENTQNNTPKKEQYSLNDDRRVKVLSPGALVAKRFFRNRLAVVGLTMLLAMFVFSFIGGVVSPYGQDQQFYTYTQMSKEYVGVTRNDKLRFVVADGQEFGSIAQSKGSEAIKKGEETFTYKDNDYEVETLNEDLYVFRQGRTVLAYASKDMVTAADGVAELSFDAKLAALTAQAAGRPPLLPMARIMNWTLTAILSRVAAKLPTSAALSFPLPMPAWSSAVTSATAWKKPLTIILPSSPTPMPTATKPSMTSCTMPAPAFGA